MENKKTDNNNNVFEVLNRKFNLDDPKEREQMRIFTESLASSAGKNAQEKDALEKKYQQISTEAKYSFSREEVNFEEAKKQAAKLRENGADENQIDEYWASFAQQTGQMAEKNREYDIFWADYRGRNLEAFKSMNPVELDMWKEHIKKNYLNVLESAENPYQVMDQLFEGKLRSAKEEVEEVPPYSGLKSSRSYTPSFSPSKEEEKQMDEDQKEYERLLAELEKSSV